MEQRIAADPLGADRRDDLVEAMLLEHGLVGDIVACQRREIALPEATEVGGDAAKAQARARVYGARDRQRFVGHDTLAPEAGVNPQVDIQRAGGRPEESLRLLDPLEAVGGRLEIVVHKLGDAGGLSLALPPGLNPSSLAKRRNGQSGNTRVNLTSGVWPIVDKMLSFMVASLPRCDECDGSR